MRLHAYMKCIEQSMELPDNIPELDRYFKDSYSPRKSSVDNVLKKARDDDSITYKELIELYNYSTKVKEFWNDKGTMEMSKS